jgi:hypothetical protein
MAPRPRLDDDTIRRILTSAASHGVLARELGVARSTISLIRLGRIYTSTCPELRRRDPVLTCGNCTHWEKARSACGLDLPDPNIEGLQFANDCTFFTARR